MHPEIVAVTTATGYIAQVRFVPGIEAGCFSKTNPPRPGVLGVRAGEKPAFLHTTDSF